MAETRKERDLLGERDLPSDAHYGIHTLRALENFPLSGRPVRASLVHAYGAVKKACARTNAELGFIPADVADALENACSEMMEGKLDDWIVVDALQGGAGTSTNMNVNEVLANQTLVLLGDVPGNYERVSPHDHVNRHQSTNDTYPTALKVAAIQQLRRLEPELVGLTEAFQRQEKAMAHVVKIGRTQLQDAVLTTLGRAMSAYAEAFGRDRWRVYKCEERLRVVNLGGTAIGTGLGAPRPFIFRAIEHLREITGLGLARSENLVETTQNADVFIEVTGILKACAANLLKVANDLRLLSSGPAGGFGELRLPRKQAGSSIMPGKVNPVIPEAVAQAAMRVMGNDTIVAQACSAGNLELNAFLPLVSESLLESIELLTSACRIFRVHCVDGLEADEARCRANVESATATATVLVEIIGYERAEAVARKSAETGRTVRDIVVTEGILPEEEFDDLLTPEHVTRLGSPSRSARQRE